MITQEVYVKGIVQGVGFRPFVYTHAKRLKLNGYVNNSDIGVKIVLQGLKKDIKSFLKTLEDSPPLLSQIDSIKTAKISTTKTYSSFLITKSENQNNKSTIVSPDIATCDECLEDVRNSDNFRHNYALTNCTNCGPRYSIIKTVPYDRVNTSMNKFKLCNLCQDEYTNPENRRYHAQPLACEKCGAKLVLYDNQGKALSTDLKAIQKIAQYINEGLIVAIKGVGGFHIVCDSTNDETLKSLRQKKRRVAKPFAVMFKDIDSLKRSASVTKKEQEIIQSKERPIVVVSKKESNLSSLIAPNIDRIGCFLPYTALHHLLFDFLNNPIVATSANLSSEPILRFKDEIIEKLPHIVDYVLDFNRDIINACDDSVVQVVNNELMLLRSARAYAPKAFYLQEKSSKKILALGANQKSTIAIAFENSIIVSPHIADLDSISSLQYFERTIETFKNFYDFKPDVIVCDKHPAYESTKWARRQDIEIVQVQHHYAHVLATMCEYKLSLDVLAFSFDGTGYGDDGNLWGGEVLIANKSSYKRAYHLKYFKLLGAQKAIKEPKRVALSLLFDNFSLEEVLNLNLWCVKSFKNSEIKFHHKAWEKGLNAPLCSSMGRLFDSIASFSNLAQNQSYEGECGLLIEKNYDEDIKQAYTYEIKDNEIDISLMIKQIIKDKNSAIICSKFINTVVDIIISIVKKEKNLEVILTGGVFQNRVLLQLVIKKLKQLNRVYYISKSVPLNDAGISLGQIYHQI